MGELMTLPKWTETDARAFEASTQTRELALRTVHGIGHGSVKLMYNFEAQTPFIELQDEKNIWSWVVKPEVALKAFNEPWGYAPPGLIPPTSEILAERDAQR